MQTEFRAIVQSEYGAPEKVLRIAKRQLKSEELGADDVLVKVIARPIHPGDIQILSALPQGGPVEPIPEGTLRVPGFEGVGTIVRLGTNAKGAKRFSEGQRVAFFPADGAWGEYVVVRYNSLLAVPNEIPDQIAAQMLINTITASLLIKAGHNSLKAPITPPVYILQNAAASGVGRLLTQVALDRGVRPIRLARSHQSAERLRSALPGPPVFSTNDRNWKEQVREALKGHKLEVAFDAVGGKAIDDLAEVVDDGGTIINFGSLGGNMGTNIYALVPNHVALKSVSIMNWFRLTGDEKQKDFELALRLATKHPELFEVAHDYEFGDFQKAIQHVSRPGKTGIILLKSPVQEG
jgi:NADPH:quinone reductase-like Zn-dependent oxidoreductase